MTPFSLAPTRASALASSISLAQALDPPLGLAARHELAQPADDLAGAQRLLGRLVERVAQHRRRLVVDALEQPAGSP